MRKAQHIVRARVSAFGRRPNLRHRFFLLALLEQQKALIISRLHMAPARSFGIKFSGFGHIFRHAAPQTIGLAQIELRISVPLLGWQTPFIDRF